MNGLIWGAIILGILAIIAVIVWIATGETDEARGKVRYFAIGGALLSVGIILALTVTTIQAGHRGVVLMWGGQVEQRIFDEGLSFRTPLAESVVPVDVRVQAHAFKDIDAASREMQTVKLTGNVNWHYDPAFVNWIYQNIGASTDFVDKILDKSLQDFLKEVTPQYSINEILNKRPEIRQKAVSYLSENLGRYHIIINDIYVADIQFSPEYMAAIEKQQVAQRQIATEQNILEQKKITAQQVQIAAQGEANAEIAKADGYKQAAVLRATGDAQSITIRATAQTDANIMLGKSLKDQPELLTYTLYNKLGDQIKVILMPAGQQFILSPDMLK